MLPELHWSELIPWDLNLTARERDVPVDGNVSAQELEIISKLVKLTDPGVLFEIGTFDGRTTLNLAAHSRDNARVYTLDLPRADLDAAQLPLDVHDRKYVDKAKSGTRFHGTDVERKITQLCGDSATFDYRPYLGKVDFVFVDGSHSYDYVISDSRVARRLIRGPGLILWHDYISAEQCCWPGLARALEDLHAHDPAFRDLKHISDTALAVLPVSSASYGRWVKSFTRRLFRGGRETAPARDSRRASDLCARLQVKFRETRVKEGTPFLVTVTAQNIGGAIWLPTSAGQGAVHLGCHLFAQAGEAINPDYCRCFLTPGRGASIPPGDHLSLEAQIPSPQKGSYQMEFDLVSEGVCWFARNGSQTVRFPVEVI